jgi:hypothetical protein
MSETPSDTVPATLLEDLVAHNLVQTGATAGGTGWNHYVRRSLLLGLEGYCEQGSLQGHSSATRDLLTRIEPPATRSPT